MSRVDHPKSTAAKGSPLWRILLLLWLGLVGAWQGPIPLIHQHGGLTETAQNRLALGRHLVQAHADELNQESFDWHCHWVMPHRGLPSSCPLDDDSETSSLASDLSLPSESVEANPLAGENLIAMRWCLLAPELKQVATYLTASARHQECLEARSTSLSVARLSVVLRC